jgi:metallo-beta-lactamase family protein
VDLDGQRITIRAGVHTVGGYSAHADQDGLLRFARGIRHKPGEIRLVHGDEPAKRELREKLRDLLPGTAVVIAR